MAVPKPRVSDELSRVETEPVVLEAVMGLSSKEQEFMAGS